MSEKLISFENMSEKLISLQNLSEKHISLQNMSDKNYFFPEHVRETFFRTCQENFFSEHVRKTYFSPEHVRKIDFFSVHARKTYVFFRTCQKYWFPMANRSFAMSIGYGRLVQKRGSSSGTSAIEVILPYRFHIQSNEKLHSYTSTFHKNTYRTWIYGKRNSHSSLLRGPGRWKLT